MGFKLNCTLIFLIFLVASLQIYFIFTHNNLITAAVASNENSKFLAKEISSSQENSRVDMFAHTEEYHWDHVPLTYNLDSCKDTFEGKIAIDIEDAFDFISERMENSMTFKKAEEGEKADITFICDIGAIKTKRDRGILTGRIIDAEAVSYYGEGNIFAPGEIYIYSTYECLGDRPTLIIHEILHLLGLEHNTRPSYPNDIMNPYIGENCEADILDKDMNYLMGIYGK